VVVGVVPLGGGVELVGGDTDVEPAGDESGVDELGDDEFGGGGSTFGSLPGGPGITTDPGGMGTGGCPGSGGGSTLVVR
jgi:hypothetical protein